MLSRKSLATALLLVMIAPPMIGPPPTHGAAGLEIKVLGNRADLVSGGDALIEVVLAAGVDPATVRVQREWRRRQRRLSPCAPTAASWAWSRASPTATTTCRRSSIRRRARHTGRKASLMITNHPIGGPVFSGAQLQPWVWRAPTVTPVTVTVPGTILSATVNSRASGLVTVRSTRSAMRARAGTSSTSPRPRGRHLPVHQYRRHSLLRAL